MLCPGCMEMKPETEKVCHNCGYAENTPFDPNYIAPGTVLNDRYAVGVKLGHNSEGATYIGYNKSIGCKPQGNGASDAAGCAGDNGYFARKHFCIKNVHFIHL